jgi:O-antigen/teichoic acid export membrane protein
MPSLALNSIVRFISDGFSIMFGMVVGVITARWLEPSGKGTLSSLTFLIIFFVQLTHWGLQEAAIVLINQKKTTFQESFSNTISALLLSSLISIGLFVLTCSITFKKEWVSIRGAIIVGCLCIPISVFANTLCAYLQAQEKLILSSIIYFLVSIAAMLGSIIFIILFPLSILGGVLATLLSGIVGLIISACLLSQQGFSFRPYWNRSYMELALKLGVGMQVPYLLITMAGRLDILITYMLLGEQSTGYYSVAISLGSLVGIASTALSLVSFPRMAYLSDADALILTLQICRYGLILSTFIGLTFVILTPFLLPLLFGVAYSKAILSTIILVMGGIFAGGQWILSRACAARGNPKLLFYSYGLSLIIMLILDFTLIPIFNIEGAAVAASISSIVGFNVCLAYYKKIIGRDNISLKDFLPQVTDFTSLIQSAQQVRIQLANNLLNGIREIK